MTVRQLKRCLTVLLLALGFAMLAQAQARDGRLIGLVVYEDDWKAWQKDHKKGTPKGPGGVIISVWYKPREEAVDQVWTSDKDGNFTIQGLADPVSEDNYIISASLPSGSDQYIGTGSSRALSDGVSNCKPVPITLTLQHVGQYVGGNRFLVTDGEAQFLARKVAYTRGQDAAPRQVTEQDICGRYSKH